jgi:elongation factor 1-beta
MLKMFIHWAVGIEMGDVAAIMKVLPESPDTDVGKLKEDLRKNLSKICTLNKIEEQELAFGLKALRLEVIVPDEEGRIGSVESAIQATHGVGQVDTDEVSLV